MWSYLLSRGENKRAFMALAALALVLAACSSPPPPPVPGALDVSYGGAPSSDVTVTGPEAYNRVLSSDTVLLNLTPGSYTAPPAVAELASGLETFAGQTVSADVTSDAHAEVTVYSRQWPRQFGTVDHDYGEGIATDSSGNVYVTGSTWGSLPGHTSTGLDDIFIAKYDSAGTEVWTRQFGTASRDYGSSLAVDSGGGVYMTGTTGGSLPGNTNTGAEDVFIVKVLP